MPKRRSTRRNDEPIEFWNSFFFKFSSKIFLGFFVVLVFLTLTQCTVKTPESPVWNTTFVMPVVNRTYNMQEIIEKIDQDEITIDSAGNIAFAVSQDLDTVSIEDSDLTTDNLSYSVSEVLGRITVSRPVDQIDTVSIDSLTAGFPSVPGFDTLIVPANTEFTANSDRSLESFASASITSGSIKIRVSNQLGLTLYDVVVRVIDAENSVTIDTGYFINPLAHNERDSLVLSLAGKTVSDSIRVSVFSHTDAFNDIHVSPNGKAIFTEVIFPEDIEVSQALAEVPALEDLVFSQRVGLSFDAGETIDVARLETGTLQLMIANNTPLVSDMVISVPNLQLDGTPLEIRRQVLGGQMALINTDLAGYDLIPDNDSVLISVVAALPGSEGALVFVQETDSIGVDAGLTNLSFSSVTGAFSSIAADFDGIHEELNVPDGFDNITLLSATLTLEVENGVDLPGLLDVQITGSNGKTITLSGTIEARGEQQTCLSTISNSQVADFLSPLPQSIDVSGSVEFGGGGYHGTIRRDDFVVARVSIRAPLEVKVNNAEITDLDLEMEEIAQDNIDAITDHVVNARFIYSITNHLPLGVTAVVHLSGDSASAYNSPQLSLDTLRADPAPVSLITGIASTDTTFSGEIHLDSLDVQILKNDSLFIRQQLFLNASDTAGVKLTDNDYITINGRIEVEYRFDGEF